MAHTERFKKVAKMWASAPEVCPCAGSLMWLPCLVRWLTHIPLDCSPHPEPEEQDCLKRPAVGSFIRFSCARPHRSRA